MFWCWLNKLFDKKQIAKCLPFISKPYIIIFMKEYYIPPEGFSIFGFEEYSIVFLFVLNTSTQLVSKENERKILMRIF